MNNQRNVSAGTGPPARRGAVGVSQGAPQPLPGRDQGQRQGWRSPTRGSTPLPTMASYTGKPSTGVQRKAEPLGERGLPSPGAIPPAAGRGGRGRGAASLQGATCSQSPDRCWPKHIACILEPDSLGSNPITHLPTVSSWASDLPLHVSVSSKIKWGNDNSAYIQVPAED